MKKLIVFILLFSANLSAEEIIAYPVPFDPSFQTLTIEDKSGEITGAGIEIKMQIFDISSDLVYSKSYNSFPIKWRGYNSKGSKIAPGFYIVKITAVDNLSGKNYKKIIRILVRKK